MKIKLIALDSSQVFASSGSPFPFDDQWQWMTDEVARRFRCHAEDVDTAESDDGELLTVGGVPKALICYDYGWGFR